MNKLDFGATFSKVFDLYGKHAAPLLMWAAAVQLVISLLAAVLFTVVLSGGNLGAALALGAVVLGFAIVASFVLSGAYIVGLDEAENTGTFPAFGSVWGRVAPRIGALIITAIIAGIGVAIGFLLLVIPAFILYTWWAVTSPVVMLEEKSGFDALGRSRELVKGNGWTVFGLIFVVGIVTSIASNIIGGIVGAILGGSDEFLGMFGSQFVSGTLLTPISALLAIVMYRTLSGRMGSDGDVLPPPNTTPTEPTTPDAPESSGPFV